MRYCIYLGMLTATLLLTQIGMGQMPNPLTIDGNTTTKPYDLTSKYWGSKVSVTNGGVLNITNVGATTDLQASSQSTVNNSGYVGARMDYGRGPESGDIYIRGGSNFNNNADGEVWAMGFLLTGNSTLNNYGDIHIENGYNYGVSTTDSTVNNFGTINKVRLNTADSVLTGSYDSHVGNVDVQHFATLDTALYLGTIDKLTLFGNLDFHIYTPDDFTTLRADEISFQGIYNRINLHFSEDFFSGGIVAASIFDATAMNMQSMSSDLFDFDLKQLFSTIDGEKYDDEWFVTNANKFQLTGPEGWELVSTGLDGTTIHFQRQAILTPEPATLTVIAFGCAGLAFAARRKKKQ